MAPLATPVAAYRLAVMHLDRRLAAGDHRRAAYGGLQDTVPRAGLLGLHARMDGVDLGSWEHPDLAQVWLRWADYLVPRRDVGIFTLGAAPRDPELRRRLDDQADAVVAALDGRARSYRELAAVRPDLRDSRVLRPLAVTGKLHLRWDASAMAVVPAVPADIDEEEARRELARRFLHWLGPATAERFARWAGVSRADAEATWRAIGPELVAVGAGWMRAEDRALLDHPAAPPDGARLLPQGDPYLYPHGGLSVPQPPPGLAEQLERSGVPARVRNGLGGRVIVAGRMVGSWGRAGAAVTVAPWRALGDDEMGQLKAELDRLAGPLGRPPAVNWLT
ncbi:MAG TPA: crosslink repair DNA glycosylase YcaQ family protein [Acidimicrobiales bacterium]|nr:crosslink repair DNA glycosylase YcaQ family protein [Acidimicrobiales bacterium]